MPWIFRYFWFLAATFLFINVVMWRRRLHPLVERGTATREEIDRFLAGVAIAFSGVPLLLGIIGVMAGWSSPFCGGFLTFDTPARAATSVVMLVCWLALLWWVWRGNGADLLARIGPALGQRPRYDTRWSVGAVRTVITLMVVVSALVTPIAWRATPMPPELACPAPPVAG